MKAYLTRDEGLTFFLTKNKSFCSEYKTEMPSRTYEIYQLIDHLFWLMQMELEDEYYRKQNAKERSHK